MSSGPRRPASAPRSSWSARRRCRPISTKPSKPPCVARGSDEPKIVEVGQAARDMYGRVPESIEVMRPMRDGVIADFEVTQRMLGHFIELVCGSTRLFKPRVMITVPLGVSSVENRAVREAALQAGRRGGDLRAAPRGGGRA